MTRHAMMKSPSGRTREPDSKNMCLAERVACLARDPYAESFTETTVVCAGCHKTLKTDRRSKYYHGLWKKHRSKCKGVAEMKAEAGDNNEEMEPDTDAGPRYHCEDTASVRHGVVQRFQSSWSGPNPLAGPHNENLWGYEGPRRWEMESEDPDETEMETDEMRYSPSLLPFVIDPARENWEFGERYRSSCANGDSREHRNNQLAFRDVDPEVLRAFLRSTSLSRSMTRY